MKLSVIFLSLTVFLNSCTSGEDLQPGAMADHSDFLAWAVDLTEHPNPNGDHYTPLMEEVVQDLYTAADQVVLLPGMSADWIGQLADTAQAVIDYGRRLERRGPGPAAAAGDETYWRVELSLTNDITAMLTRLLPLMQEGYFDRAEIVLLFCLYQGNPEWERDSRILSIMMEELEAINTEADTLIQKGIEFWDRGERDMAHESYIRALVIYPKNPWALWELGLDRIDYHPDFHLSGEFEPYYQMIRRYDPLYELAWVQGVNTSDKADGRRNVSEIITPAYDVLWIHDNVEPNMLALSDGLAAIGEWEYALYGYKYLLYSTWNDGFNTVYVDRIISTLEDSGMERLIPFFKSLVVNYDLLHRSQN